jgi:hypothetical protein
LLVESFEERGIHGVNFADGESVSIQSEPIPKIEDPEKFRLWCIANGYGNELRLNTNTAYALVKAKMLAGEAPPDGMIVGARTKVVWR